MSEPGVDPISGISSGEPWSLPERHPACRRREAQPGSCTERENLSLRCQGRRPSGTHRKDQSTEAEHRGGAARSRDEGSVMGLDRRGCVVQPRPRANRRREETVDKAKPFDIPKREVWEAFKRVKANQGAAGVDRQSIADFEADLSNNLYKLWNRLSSGSYFPPPVRRVDIPKADGGTRPLGIPTVADRIAQEVARRYLEPDLEPVFHTDSYGYRPGRSAIDAVRQARALWSALQERFAACKLVLHPEKTKIVYCKDANRHGDFPNQSFDFLGFSFRARKALGRGRHAFACFLPAASPKALTSISRTVRRWALHHRSDKSLPDLAEMYNSCIRGWINYYSHFYKTQLRPTLKRIDLYVIRWARRKFKRLRRRTKGARDWFDRLRRVNPTLFAHWQLCHGNGRTSGAV